MIRKVILLTLLVFGTVLGGAVTIALGGDPLMVDTSPPASQCVQDANANGVGDVVDVEATAAETDCQVYLPLVAAQWRQPWPTPTPTPDYYEPAINVIFNVHMEPFRPDPLPLRQQEYEARRQKMEPLLEWTETYGVELTVKAGGEFVEFCLDSGECGESPPSGLFACLRAQGVEVGTHWHTQYQRGPHDWPDAPEPDETTA